MADRRDHPFSTIEELDLSLLGGPRTLTLHQLADRAGLSVESVRTFWRTLGLPVDDEDAVAFTEDDVAALRRLSALISRGEMDLGTTVALTRALGHSSERLVLWQVEALVEDTARRLNLDDVSARLVVLDRLAELGPELEDQLVYSWRRQLAAVAGRYAAEFAESRATDASASDALPLVRAVGMADLVSFTASTAGLGAHDLADYVQRFESIARDVVAAAHGRVVKTVGDAVLFVADDAAAAARIGLGLVRELGSERVALPVRVGLVWGRVLARFGDVFGPPVNLASRLCDAADPGTVFTDQGTATLLRGVPGVRVVARDSRELPGIGAVTPVELLRS